MLLSLHVKNFALIEEVEVEFRDHLNILTGETGAGKSIIIGSVNAALGAKISKDMIRKEADYALIELIFQSSDPLVTDTLTSYDLPVNGDEILISRKLMPSGRSIAKVNGETVTLAILKMISELLLDIHGQHEHQSLLNTQKHLEIVDAYAGEEAAALKQEVSGLFQEYRKCFDMLEKETVNEEERNRELSFLQYEYGQIKNAKLVVGEDEELAKAYRRLSHAAMLAEGIGQAYTLVGEGEVSLFEQLGRAIRQISRLTEYDSRLETILSQLTDIESCLNELNHDLINYLNGIELNGEEFQKVSDRLELIQELKKKYGNSITSILEYAVRCEERLERYQNFDEYIAKLKEEKSVCAAKLKSTALRLSKLRKEKAAELSEWVEKALLDLNFQQIQFSILCSDTEKITSNGCDELEFMISVNLGEPLMPLAKVASGGELSRVMLAIKSVFAKKDSIDSLIFDEIDTGISGRTAQKVSEKLVVIARSHQVICITHLPQIAAMADHHLLIEKESNQIRTFTSIRPLNEDESSEEIARLLGGAEITYNVLRNAEEMKALAKQKKEEVISSLKTR